MDTFRILGALALGCQIFAAAVAQDKGPEAGQDSGFRESFDRDVFPLLQRFCADCHDGQEAEAGLDLGPNQTFSSLTEQPALWLKVREVLRNRQMPPEDAPQPAEAERTLLEDWVESLLEAAARERAGDPGPVILRRLSNAEYDYSVQDLTGVGSLQPTREFPVDNAAGEGFTNCGAAQGMSPALMSKYLDAAHELANHVVLLPDGIRFSPFSSRRDHSDEHLGMIRDFYRRYADESDGMPVDLQGIRFDTNEGGVIPLSRYLQAVLENRSAIAVDPSAIPGIAARESLSPYYLARLWEALSREDPESARWGLAELREAFRVATPADVPALVSGVEQTQKMLWQFNPVGQLGRAGGPTAWMEPASPVALFHEFQLVLPGSGQGDQTLFLNARDPVAGGPGEPVVWQDPRLEFDNGHPPLPLAHLVTLAPRIEALMKTEVPATARYLAAIRAAVVERVPLPVAAGERGLDPDLLMAWAELLEMGPDVPEVRGHLSERLDRVAGLESLSGWGSPATPSLLANQSQAGLAVSTFHLTPRSIFVHPSPTLESVVAWQSPIEGRCRIRGEVADADGSCGNGFAWRIVRINRTGRNVLFSGTVDNGQPEAVQQIDGIDLNRGDVVALVVNPRDGDHSCDTTRVDLTVTEVAGTRLEWKLSSDAVDRIPEGNPLADSRGNPSVWHFCAQPFADPSARPVPANSLLAKWQEGVAGALPVAGLQSLELAIGELLQEPADTGLSEADRILRDRLMSWHGPLDWLELAARANQAPSNSDDHEPVSFGRHPDGLPVDSGHLVVRAPHTVQFRLPARLLAGATFRTRASISDAPVPGALPGSGALQVRVSLSDPRHSAWACNDPLLARPGPARDRLEQAFEEYRSLFPAALCYARIVPVDEVVTLTLYHREDRFLQQLMLDETQREELDRLWDQLRFVSQEPLLLTTALEQISEFATQDRPDLVPLFAAMRPEILQRASSFEVRQTGAEPVHLESTIRLADRAWRRPLTTDEQQSLRELYLALRKSGSSHPDAIRLTLARILVSPAFLYRLEQAPTGPRSSPVQPRELACRLSYFLWSSLPDGELAAAAERGGLTVAADRTSPNGETATDNPAPPELVGQTRRMLQDPKARRMAIQFACQWMHVRDFDRNNNKSEQLFPEFARLRAEMHEETVRFFEDLIRNDRSILEIVDSDHTFLNSELARHYGIDDVTGPAWQRVDGMRSRGRGGVLGMASVLASQSGAARTSPILRGVWVSETLLGERLPRPPANVPPLPEALPEGLTARQLIELHSSQADCARCHARIDPYGIALEQFDAIGRLVPEPVDTAVELVDGTPVHGLAGMRDYLVNVRREDFVRQFCRKLLGFALGREVLLSDEPLLERMQSALAQQDYRFSAAVETLVTSPQFLSIRGSDAPE